ncbi:unnamed protein product, partial [Symbiodinium necroappetens]
HAQCVDLQLPCIESGILTLSLDLQRAAWQKQLSADAKFPQKRSVKRDVKLIVGLAKQKLRGKLLEAMRHLLTQMSRQQALQRLVPRAPDTKPSLVKKKGLKHQKKTALGKAAKALAKAKALDDKPSALVPGSAPSDPVSEKASEFNQATKGPLYLRVCWILREDSNCGKSGKCNLHNLLTNQVSLTGRLVVSLTGVGDASATVFLSDKEVCEVDPFWKSPKKWKNPRLKGDLKQMVLRACGGSSLFLESSGKFFAAEPLELLAFKKSYPQMLLGQHLRYAWERRTPSCLARFWRETTTGRSFCRLLWIDSVLRTRWSSCQSGGKLSMRTAL